MDTLLFLQCCSIGGTLEGIVSRDAGTFYKNPHKMAAIIRPGHRECSKRCSSIQQHFDNCSLLCSLAFSSMT
ncbi:uncharacterized protein LOC111065295 isoform X2 [Drosophila obscura]|uniref:uncharacterized protein LOC111065295 isoform X2 n=1 Tax=Drosophila obscura TaxID=7282 RepID=UPI001BB1C6DA|nr:uncharacterized protein LOC111065295 isoform X2 [Drosophila obscura]